MGATNSISKTATRTSGPAGLTIKNTGAGRAAVYIYDDIGPDWAGMIGAETIRKELANLGLLSVIDLHINSRGGSVNEATAIYNLLKDHPANITTYIDGIAASSAGWVAMSGDTIKIAENGYLMLHDPTNIVMGDAGELRKAADVLDQTKGSIARTFASRTGIDEAEIANMMSGETWLDGATAVEKGFADELSPNKAINCAMAFDCFNNVPERAWQLARNANANSDAAAVAAINELTKFSTEETRDQQLVAEMNRLMV